MTAIGVDSFAPGIIENNQFYTTKGDLRKRRVITHGLGGIYCNVARLSFMVKISAFL